MKELEILAFQFRNAIENSPRSRLPVTLQCFPDGACGDAVLLLGHYLKSQGLGVSEYVLGCRGEGDDYHSHAWLRRGNIVVDITADQFPEIDSPVIVTTQTAWYENFDSEVLHEADFTIFDDATVSHLREAYVTIIHSLQAEIKDY